MKPFRLALALAVALSSAANMAYADGGKPGWVPPSNPPQTLKDRVCGLLPSAAAAYVPFCQQ
jgi:hypothetical protein